MAQGCCYARAACARQLTRGTADAEMTHLLSGMPENWCPDGSEGTALASVEWTTLPTLWPQPAVARTEQIGRLSGASVYVVHFARAHIVPGDIIAGSHFGV